MTTTYPPDRHLLRDLRLSFEHQGTGASRAWMPAVPELAAADGAVRAGALATLVDVIGGGLAAQTAQPDWIATADLTLHLTGAVVTGTVEARAHVAHAGRTTVVIEVTLHDDAGRQVGLATMSFARLPRRDQNPDLSDSMTTGTSTMALPESAMQGSLLDEIGVRVVDAAAGVLEAPVRDWSRNSLGSMQGGAVAAVIDAAADAAARRYGKRRRRHRPPAHVPRAGAGRADQDAGRRARRPARRRDHARRAGRHGQRRTRHDRGPGRRDLLVADRTVTASQPSATGGFRRPAPGEGVGGYVRVGLHEVESGPGDMPRVVGHAPAAAHLRGPDGRGVRAGMLLTMLDMVGGLCGGLAALPDGWVVSTNLSARTVRTEHRGPFRLDAWVLRAGSHQRGHGRDDPRRGRAATRWWSTVSSRRRCSSPRTGRRSGPARW